MSRTFRTYKLPSRHVQTAEKEYLWFSGTDYLGMAHHPQLIRFLTEGLQTLGTHYGSSRNNTLQIEAFKDAENALANFTGAENAILVSSGMLAGALVRSHLSNIIQSIDNNKVLVEWEAPMLHPALRRLETSNASWSDWARTTSEEIRRGTTGNFHIIYTDAIGTPRTTEFDLSYFQNLNNCLLVVDDSHGLGVTGTNGKGTIQAIQKLNIKNYLIVSSLNKAMGIPGGVLLGLETILREFRQTPTYAGASPIAPVYAHALTQMILQNQYSLSHSTLVSNTFRFNERLGKVRENFFYHPSYPVYTTGDEGLFEFLEAKNILTSCFHYPSKSDPLLTRIVITASHLPEDIDHLAQCCIEYYT